jgi:hypothetical protein
MEFLQIRERWEESYRKALIEKAMMKMVIDAERVSKECW